MEDCQWFMLRFCVIGYPVKHSLSPRIHNRAFRKLRISARYEAISVHPRDLSSFIRKFRKIFTGANVTIPHKEKIMHYLDALSPEARAIGAVNTIVNRGGKLIGYNTDMYGAMEALKNELRKMREKWLSGKKVAVLGAGGAARAVVYGFKKAGAKVVILNRTLSRAKKLAKEFGCECGQLEDFRKFAELGVNILINTTSVGMMKKGKRQKLKVNFSAILENMREKPTVMDIVYTPRLTKFLRDAQKAGCKIITGDKMFLAQAVKSFELWTGTRPKFVKL